MADFQMAITDLLKAEGGFAKQDNNNGAVNFGITAEFLRLIGRPNSVDDVRKMTVEQATEIYRKYFWDLHKIGQILDQRIALLLFHMTVNNPAKVAIMSFQLALQDVGQAVPATGFAGPKTVLAVNSVPIAKRETFIARFKGRILDRYKRLAAANPKLYADDLAGWEGRLSKL